MHIGGSSAGHTSQQSSAASDADTLRFEGFIGSIGSVLTGDSGVADVEDQDEEHPSETQAAPSQQSIPALDEV